MQFLPASNFQQIAYYKYMKLLEEKPIPITRFFNIRETKDDIEIMHSTSLKNNSVDFTITNNKTNERDGFTMKEHISSNEDHKSFCFLQNNDGYHILSNNKDNLKLHMNELLKKNAALKAARAAARAAEAEQASLWLHKLFGFDKSA